MAIAVTTASGAITSPRETQPRYTSALLGNRKKRITIQYFCDADTQRASGGGWTIVFRQKTTKMLHRSGRYVEDPGRWYLVNDLSNERHATKEDAIAQASKAVLWLNRD